jgi:alpha-1,2-mannosyltransferase
MSAQGLSQSADDRAIFGGDRSVGGVALWAFGWLSASAVIWYAVALSQRRQVDFEVYRMGGQHVFGTGLYSAHITTFAGNLPFTYTPLAALLFWPFSLLSTQSGQLLWDLANVAGLTAMIAISSAATRRRPLRPTDWRLALICVAPAAVLLWPVRYELGLGQIDIFLVLMILTDLSSAELWPHTRLPKGVLVGLAAAVKLTPLIFVPFLLLTRQWKTARNAVVAFVASTASMALLASRSSWSYFTKYAFDVGRVGDSTITNNQTVRAALFRLDHTFPSGGAGIIVVIAFCAGLVVAALAWRNGSPFLGILTCAATGLMVSPISWQHHYVWCVPVIVWLIFGVDRPSRGIAWAAVATIIFMVIPPGQSGGFNVASYLRENAYVVGALSFLGLSTVLLWSRARALAREHARHPSVGALPRDTHGTAPPGVRLPAGEVHAGAVAVMHSTH